MLGQTVGHYRVAEKLGAGGMGEVFRAQDVRLGRSVTIKFLPDEAGKSPAALERFQREARAASALNHPNICTLYDLGEHRGQPYIVMEFLEGKTIEEWIGGRPVSMEKLLDVAIHVAEALAVAHGKGIIHRDIKPSNLFLTQSSQVKVLDFGLAKLTEHVPSESPASSIPTRDKDHLTSPGVAVGTVAYMSPEQALGKELDARTDIFSLGVVLYEMATGRRPFSGGTTAAVFDSILHSAPTAAVRLNPEIPPRLEEIIDRTLEKDPNLRYQSVSDLGADLKRLRRDMTSGGSAEIRLVRPHRRVAYAVLGGLVLALAVTGIGLFRSRPIGGIAEGSIGSIAVLPFENVGGDPDTEYLAEGLASGLLYRIAELSELRVIASSSTRHYKGRKVDPIRVGRELNVQAVVIGQLTTRRDGLSLHIELIDTRDSRLLWGERYERGRDEVMGLEEAVAREMAAVLNIPGRVEEEVRVDRPHTRSPEAYEAFLRGRAAFDRLTDSDVKRAISFFERATELDREYALAHAWIGMSYFRLTNFVDVEPTYHEGSAKVRRAAERSIEIDRGVGMAHAVLGSVFLFYDWNWEKAREELELGTRLDPNNPWTWILYSWYLTVVRRHDQAVQAARTAVELSPVETSCRVVLVGNLKFAGRSDEAESVCLGLVGLDPAPLAHRCLTDVHELRGNYESAIESYEIVQSLQGEPEKAAGLRKAYASSGPEGYWRWRLQDYKEQFTPSECMECILPHLRLGQFDEAFEELERGFENRSGWLMIFLAVDPVYEPIRGDPRFQELMRRVNLPR